MALETSFILLGGTQGYPEINICLPASVVEDATALVKLQALLEVKPFFLVLHLLILFIHLRLRGHSAVVIL